jgi:AcrR family transcriptional regulator
VNKKETILVSALKLLTEKGVHNTPMSAIAKAAGTGMGTIYNYFANKEILINEIYISIKEEERWVFQAFDSTQPIKTQFEMYFTSIVDFYINNPLFFNFMEQLQASPIITKDSKEVGLSAVDSVLKLLEKGQQDRVVKAIDIDELLLFIGGAVLAYLRWYYNQTEVSDDSLFNQKMMVWDAIKE